MDQDASAIRAKADDKRKWKVNCKGSLMRTMEVDMDQTVCAPAAPVGAINGSTTLQTGTGDNYA